MSILMNYFLFIAGILAACTLNAYSIKCDESKSSSFAVTTDENAKILKRDPIYLFIERDGEHNDPAFPIQMTESMIELLKLDDLYDKKDSFSEVVRKTQEKWLASVQGKNMQASLSKNEFIERTDFKDSSEQIAAKEKVERIVRAMGLFGERNPALCHYKYAAWLGSFLQGARYNLHQLVKAWENGCRFQYLVLFSGERYLRKGDGQEDDLKALCDLKQSPFPFKEGWQLPLNANYETEYDMMRLIFDQVQLPKEMAEALKDRVIFVNAPKGRNVRPGTKDCYIEWLKTNPEPGAVLAASYPLLWVAQHIAGETVLGPSYPLDTIAPALSKELYEEKKVALAL